MKNEFNDKTASLTYNLRNGKSIRRCFVKKSKTRIPVVPTIKKYNLRPRRNTNKKNIIEKSTTISSRKRNNDLNFDANEDETEQEEFTWENFNTYHSADGISNVSLDDKRDWVSATGVKHFLMKEPLLDWFDLYYLDKGYNDSQRSINQNVFLAEKAKKKCEIDDEMSKLNIFFEMGIKFESEVIKYLRNKYPDQVQRVCTSARGVHSELNNITFQYMKEGIPIIEQAALYNFKNKTYGVADILIRSDWINKLFDNPILDTETEKRKAPFLNGDYHYRVIDIKWTTMYLCSNARTLRNSQRFPAYKGQMAIYNAALGLMQGFIPEEAYILTKSWNLNGGQAEGHNCFTQLGIIDFNDFDNKYIKETANAIKWVRNVRYNGNKWTCTKPTIPELYPNMCNRYDAPYHNVKRELAEKLKELTQIWMVGVKHRKIAHSNQIYSWDDPKCSSDKIGIYGKKIAPIVDKIIAINRSPNEVINPQKIKNNINNWQTSNELDFYLDFESITGCLYNRDINLKNSKSDNQILFLIGVGYDASEDRNNDKEKNKKWNYRSFLANSIDRNEEKRVVNEFINFVNNRINNYMIKYNIKDKDLCKPRFFHWSHAEKSIITLLNKRHDNQWHEWKNSVTWIDMYKVFIDEPIVLKGARKFNLKEIAKTMASHNMIQTKWQSDGPENGLDAMLEAISYYRYKSTNNILYSNNSEHLKYINIIGSIVDYNEVDCKVVYEIVTYLRKYHRTALA